MQIAILTPLEVEYRAVKRWLDSPREDVRGHLRCTLGRFRAERGAFEIILYQTGSRNSEVALAAERLIALYYPAVVILTGIAGGVKDAAIGDVVVGNRAYGYESGKSTDEGFSSRPQVHHYSKELLDLARSVSEREQWLMRISEKPEPPPRVFFGPIASGDQVVASTQSEAYRRIKQHYNDTLALEMESIGFARTMADYPLIRSINIRSISDLLDGKDAQKDTITQPQAAAHAAAFTFGLIHQLNPAHLKYDPMDEKTIAQKIVSTLFPLLRLDSVKEIGQEFREATDGAIKEIWEKVRPIFIEEIESEETPEEAKGAVKVSLREKLKQDSKLKQQLENLLDPGKASAGNQVRIENSKNVVQGSNIKADGNIQIGDNHTSS